MQMIEVFQEVGLEQLGGNFEQEKVYNITCLQCRTFPQMHSDQQLNDLGVTTIGDRAALRAECLCHPLFIDVSQVF